MITITFTIIGLAVGLTTPLEVFLVIERLGMEKGSSSIFSAAADGIGMLIGGIVARDFRFKSEPEKKCSYSVWAY